MRFWIHLLLTALVLAPGPGLHAGGRVALLIGNNKYANLPEVQQLKSPVNDARDLAGALQGMGYVLVTGGPLVDAGKDAIITATEEFAARAKDADAAVFYFSGHGIQVGEENFLMASDTPRISSYTVLRNRGVHLREAVMVALEEAQAKTKVIILDCCRDNPFAAQVEQALGNIGKSLRTKGGLGEISGYGPGFFLAFATSPGTVANDGNGQRNSPFTAALLTHLKTAAGDDITPLFRKVKASVRESSGADQVPWTNDSLDAGFAFAPAPSSGGMRASPAASAPSPPPAAEAPVTRPATVAVSPSSQEPPAVVRGHLQDIVAQNWQSAVRRLDPDSLARRKAQLVATRTSLASTNQEGGGPGPLSKVSVRELTAMTPQEVYVADRSAVHAAQRVSSEILTRKRETLAINILGSFTEDGGRVAHVLVRTEQSTPDTRIEELLLLSLRSNDLGGWWIVPDMNTPETRPLPEGRDLYSRVEALGGARSDFTSVRVGDYLHAVVSQAWSDVSQMLLPASLERRKKQMSDAVRQSSTITDQSAKLSMLGLKDIKELEDMTAARAYVVDREALHRRQQVSPAAVARKQATYRMGVIGIAEEEGRGMRHVLVRTCQETDTTVIAELLLISLFRDGSSGKWYIMPDAQQPVTTPLKQVEK